MVKKSIFTMLFHIAISDQNRELDAVHVCTFCTCLLIFNLRIDYVHNAVMFLTIYAAITRFSSCAFCICVIYQ